MFLSYKIINKICARHETVTLYYYQSSAKNYVCANTAVFRMPHADINVIGRRRLQKLVSKCTCAYFYIYLILV